MYNSIDNTWVQNIKSLPLPLHYASAATYDGKIYVVRGYPGNWITSNNLFINDSDTNNWTFGNPMPTPRGSPNANFVNGILYVIGGDSYDYSLVQVEAYGPLTEQWTSLAPMPTARHELGVVSYDDKIYAIGGGPHNGLTVSNKNEIYYLNQD